MAAPDNLSRDQFSVEHQGATPLPYDRTWTGRVERLGAVNPEVQHEPVTRRLQDAESIRSQEYYAPQVTVGRGLNGRPLKTPKTIQNPSAAAPGTAAFLDYEDRGSDVHIHYVNTHRDFTGHGLASTLITELADRHPDRPISFGRVMSPKVWTLKERLEAQGRQTSGRKDF
jgi:hypothetical protein